MNNDKVYKLTYTAMMTSLCYTAFSVLQFKIPTPAGYTSIHLGNVFCVLTALLFDGITGGIAGAIGMAIGDLLDPVYAITTPKTIILKFVMGYLVGYIAHNKFHINNLKDKKLLKATIISITIPMLLNVILEPLFSYFYYSLILNNADKANSYLTIAKYISTSINAVATTIITTPLYLALRKRNIV